jgi:hypothetical protein
VGQSKSFHPIRGVPGVVPDYQNINTTAGNAVKKMMRKTSKINSAQIPILAAVKHGIPRNFADTGPKLFAKIPGNIFGNAPVIPGDLLHIRKNFRMKKDLRGHLRR